MLWTSKGELWYIGLVIQRKKNSHPILKIMWSFLYYAHSKYLKVNKEMNEPAHLNQAQGQRGVSRDGNGYMEPDTRWTLFY